MNRVMFNRRRTVAMAVPCGRRWLSARIILLMFCLCLFNSDAMALYSIFNSGVSDVNGIGNDGSLLLDGSEFGTVVATATTYNAYSIYSNGGDITIDGLFDTVGLVSAITGTYNAYGLYSNGGSITTDGLDGTIAATAGTNWAVGLFSPGGDVNTADIDGTISATAGTNWAVGLYGDTINTGAIDGTIVVTASDSYAYGLYSNGAASIHTGDINGTIYAEATYGSDAYAIYSGSDITVGDIGSDANIVAIAETGNAYGLYSGGGISSIHIGNINGKISADVNDGSGAYAIYSNTDIIIDGNIGSTALIRATATGGVEESAYGMYSNGSVNIGDVNGTISAEMTDGSDAYAIYANQDITIGNIGSDANIWAAAEYGNAAGLYSGGGQSIHIGDVNGVIAADVNDGSYASGIYSASGITTGHIGSDAQISATVSEEYAVAVGSLVGDVNTGDIDGTVTAIAGSMYATGLSAGNGSVITGDINGTISAMAEDGYASGLYSGVVVGSIHIGDVNGVIIADVNNGSWAYGIYSDSGITVGDIGSDALISATAGEDWAVGLYSVSGDVNTADIDGTITAIAGSMYAAGLRANNGSVITGDIDGTISAMAEDGIAYGLYSSDMTSIHTGDVNGIIIADVNNGSDAYGMYSDSNIITGNIESDALISATASDDNAYALYSALGDVNTGDIASDAQITATAGGSWAGGLFSMGGSIYTGDVDGTIDANASGNYAYGLYSGGGGTSIHTGDINGTITAASGGNDAAGLYSASSSVTTGAINGTISATAAGIGNDTAYGIYGDGSVTIGDVNGTISAEMTNGTGAYAIRSNTDITTGDITSNALISAMAEYGDAYGLYSGGGVFSIHTGDVNGIIIADVNNGSNAYGMYSATSIMTGDFGEDANISATAYSGFAYGLYSSGGSSIHTGDINGKISAEATDGSEAYALYSASDITVGDIGSTAEITATAGGGGSYAAGLYSGGGTSIHTGDVNGVITADATSGSFAYGMYSSSSITVGNIGSDANITANAGNNQAYGLYSDSNSITTGDIDGTITATAGSRRAYGLRSDGSLTTGAINGTITATAMDERAFGLCSDSNSVTTGAINGTVSATAEYAYAYGLYSGGGASIHTGDVNGVITADVNDGSFAYGMYSDSDITTGNIGSDANITANAGNNQAYGMYSSGGDSITTGDIDGTITTTAGNDRAYGLRSDGPLTTGAINGTITATAGNERASGLYSDSNSVTTSAINGTISATAGTDNAYGLRSQGSITTGAINGTIDVDAGGNDAIGLRSYDSITTGDIGGTIDVNAGGDRAFALRSDGSLTTGAIDGTITVKAGNDRAVGLYSLGENSLTTGAISGTIDVNAAGDFAYGILSWGPMDVTVDGGTVSAVAVAGPNVASIQSGQMTGIPITLETQDANDTVEIVAGSTIIGDIDLAQNGTDNDILTLSGVNTNSTILDYDIWNVENIYITGGTWYLNGNVYTSNIALNGGILSGSGTLSNNLNVGNGVLAPGGSIGSITIDGDLTFGPGGTYEVDVNNSENADNTVVTGTAYLDGTIRGNVYGGERIDHSFDVNVLDAGTIVGEFANVTGTTLFPIFGVDYSSVILTVEMDYAHYATTANEYAVGNALNYIVGNGLDTGDMNDVLTAIENLPSGAAVNNAYDQMMPQDALGLPEVIRNAMNQYSEGLFGRMGDIRNAGLYAMSADSRYLLASTDNSVALPPKTDEWMPFAKGFGVWGDRDKDSDTAGYQYNVYGMAGGIDKLVSDNTLIGISVGGSKANVDYGQWGTNSDIDSLFASLYGSYFVDDWHFGVTLGYGHSWYDSQRGIPAFGLRAESDHHGNSYSAAAELGKNLGDESTILEPVVGLGYTLVRERGYTEKGAGALNLKVGSETTDGIYSKLGIRAAKEFRSEKNPDRVLVPNVSAFWIHDFADRVELSSSFIGGGSFTTQGQDPVRDMFNLGAGLNVYSGKNTRLFVDYTWQLSSDFQSNMVQARIQRRF